MYCGAMPAEQPYVIISQFGTAYWFAFLFFLAPIVGKFESPKNLPLKYTQEFKMSVKIITPYVFEEEIKEHKNTYWMLNCHYERDTAGIGCDLMFQKMWKQFPDDDIFILHADMTPSS